MEEKEKPISEKVIIEQKTAPNGIPVYGINEPWVQQYIADFGCEPSFF
ncbi:MAG: hypothetical protein LUG99_03360 [Lachnospiraceae bacterium]|nr:hypothetical protein [Lachnospiraceae bacterium]